MDRIRWGILGTGSIANQFAQGLTAAPSAELVAVGSRARETADAFGDKWDIPRRHVGYEALAADPDVDAVYVAVPHVFHKDAAILCLEGGKAVLCEKPLTVNAHEARKLIDCARRRGLFLMEAMWTRFFPVMCRLRELLAEAAIGDVRMLHAAFGFRSGASDPKQRLFNLELGGGALLDVGVYTVAMASMVFGGPPLHVAGLPDLGPTGVDEQSAMVLGHDGGRLAVLSCAVRTSTRNDARIAGTEGRIYVHDPFWRPSAMTLTGPDGKDQLIEMPYEGNGYNYEAEEVARCLRDGRAESEVMPLDESLTIVETMDRLRAQWGLKYPNEGAA